MAGDFKGPGDGVIEVVGLWWRPRPGARASAAARHYLRTLHTDLADTGVLQISGPVGDCDAGNYVIDGAANLPGPQKPADLADAMWGLYLKRDRFDQVFGA